MSKVIYHDFRKAAPETETRAAKLPILRNALDERFASARRVAELRQVQREATEAMRTFQAGGDLTHFSAPIRDFAESLRCFKPSEYRFALCHDNEGWWIQPERKNPFRDKVKSLLAAVLGG